MLDLDQMVGADKGFWNQPGVDKSRTWGPSGTPRQRTYAGGQEYSFQGHQGPAQGGPEAPGTPNSSPSTLRGEGGLIAAMQSMMPRPPRRMPMPGPEGDAPQLGATTDSTMTTPMKVLAQLVRGVY